MVDDAGDGARNVGPDIGRLLARRAAEYVELWESAATRLTNATYRSENLLDDWFRFWGRVARDVTAASALVWGAAGAAARDDRPKQ